MKSQELVSTEDRGKGVESERALKMAPLALETAERSGAQECRKLLEDRTVRKMSMQ